MDYPYITLGPAFQVLALLLLFAFVAAVITIVIFLASLPGKIAAKRNHPQAKSVNLCGWLGLPTGLVWVGAIAWAYWNSNSQASLASGIMGDSETKAINSKIDQLENLLSGLEQHMLRGEK